MLLKATRSWLPAMIVCAGLVFPAIAQPASGATRVASQGASRTGGARDTRHRSSLHLLSVRLPGHPLPAPRGRLPRGLGGPHGFREVLGEPDAAPARAVRSARADVQVPDQGVARPACHRARGRCRGHRSRAGPARSRGRDRLPLRRRGRLIAIRLRRRQRLCDRTRGGRSHGGLLARASRLPGQDAALCAVRRRGAGPARVLCICQQDRSQRPA